MRTDYLIIAVVLIGTWLFARGMLKRRLHKGGSYEDELDSLEKKAKARDTLENILVQIQEVSKECIAKIDNKIRMLNQLIIEADEKIAKLLALRDEINQLSTQARHKENISTLNPLHQTIFNCAEKGLSVDDISRQTGLEKGEVELILSLKNIKQK